MSRTLLVAMSITIGLAVPSPALAGKRVGPEALEALRTAGSVEIPPDPQAFEAAEAGAIFAIGVDVCIGKKGAVTSVTTTTSSGNETYDAWVEVIIAKSWKFRPYRKGKKKLAVCAPFALQFTMPTAKPTTVTPQALEALRISGEKQIIPDDVTKTAILDAGKTRLVIPIKLCITDAGDVKSVSILKSSGFADYDAKIQTTMAAWRYKPFEINGKPAPVCTAITLIYVQK
jgi:TonB family protein